MQHHESINAIVDGQVFGARNQWERHETGPGGHTVYVKPIDTRDVEMKARIASRFDEMGFITKFFRESGKEFIAIDAMKEKSRYANVEEAFVNQILKRL